MSVIDYEITYPSSPRFVFHDSRGIEAGAESVSRGMKTGEESDSSDTKSEEKLDPSKLRTEFIQEFINDRAQQTRTGDQLHAIWYVFDNSYNPDMKLLKVLHANGHAKGA
jgi:hypothetical protein